MKRTPFIFVLILLLTPYLFYKFLTKDNPLEDYQVGQAIDSLNHVMVYYNGGIRHSDGISKSEDDYEFGLKYESKEFVNRYFYEHYGIKCQSKKMIPQNSLCLKLKMDIGTKKRG